MPLYAIYKVGVVSTWSECQRLVTGVSNARFKKFANKKDAEFFAEHGEMPPTEAAYGTTANTNPANGKLCVYTDGACRGNGSRGAQAGIGVFFGERDARNISRRVHAPTVTNNMAELLAIQAAVRATADSDVPVEICTDSEYAMRCCTDYGRRQRAEGWTNRVPNVDLIKEIVEELELRPRLSFRHVRAHTGKTDADSVGNAHADRLANEAIDMCSSSI